MKLSYVLPLAVLGSAFVLPAEEVFSELTIEDHHAGRGRIESALDDAAAVKDELLSGFQKHLQEALGTSKHAWEQVSKTAGNAMDEAFGSLEEGAEAMDNRLETLTEDMRAWAEGHDCFEAFDDGHHGPPPPHGPPHDGPPHDGPPHHGKPGSRPHKPDHKHKPNQTIYELLTSNKYTTKLAKLISEYDDLVEALNSTSANYTVFAPSDKAFEKIPKHAPKPSKEQLKAILSYHVVPDFYPALRVLSSHTAPTLLKGKHLSSEPEAQRIVFKLGLKGLTVNLYARVFPINIFATNGVIHGLDSLLIPPPNAIEIVDLFPGQFSTLELGLGKTGLLEKLNTTNHPGGTLFAPSNFAFQKLGPKINAFLFSKYGVKYLKALLEYHVVPGVTLYSDAIYKAEKSTRDVDVSEELPKKGHFHVDLPTFLKDRSLSVDVARFAGFITIRINGFSSVSFQDVIAEDGVIQVVSQVLIPPRKAAAGQADEHWDGGEMSVEEFKERLGPFVAKSDL